MLRVPIPLVMLAALAVTSCGDVVTPPEPPPLGPGAPAPDLIAAAGGPRYSIRALDVETVLPAGARIGSAGFLNDRGQVTAQVFRFPEPGSVVIDALVWDSEAGTVELIEIGGLSGLPLINDEGQLAGSVQRLSPATGTEPFLWTPGVGLERLGFSGRAAGLNDGGEIVGHRLTEALPGGEAFHWSPVSGLTPLGVLEGALSSRAMGVNGSSMVVGFSGARAFAWDAVGGMTVLEGEGLVTRAEAANDAGQIVGVHFFQVGETTGAVWADREASQVLLPCEPPAFEDCRAHAINERGEILGSYGDDEAELPVIWLEGVAYDLTSLIEAESPPPFVFALGINDRGQIGGFAPNLTADGRFVNRPVILTPLRNARQVAIDVKPNSDPSSFNLDGQGAIPVAVLGEANLHPSDIDPETLVLNGLVILHRGNGEPQCEAEDFNQDGFPDLVCQFEDDPSRWTGPDDFATLTGALFDGTAIEGTDAIRLVQQ